MSFIGRLLGWEKIEARAQLAIPRREPSSALTPAKAITHPTVLRCIQIIATAVSQLDVLTYKYGELVKSPLVVRLPDSNRSRSAFIKRTVTDLAMYGNAFWRMSKSSNGQVNGLQALEPDHVHVHFTKAGIKRYTYSNKEYTDNDIAHLRLNEIPGEVLGVGPLQMHKEFFTNALELTHYNNAVLENGVPLGFLKTDKILTSEQADSYSNRWMEVTQTGKIPTLGQDLDFRGVSMSPKDLLLVEQLNYIERVIAVSFGVPPAMLEVPVSGTSLTYQTRKDLEETLYRLGISAYLGEIESGFNKALPRGSYVKFDIASRLKPSETERYSNYSTALEQGFMTINEVRELEGLPQLNEGSTAAGTDKE